MYNVHICSSLNVANPTVLMREDYETKLFYRMRLGYHYNVIKDDQNNPDIAQQFTGLNALCHEGQNNLQTG